MSMLSNVLRHKAASVTLAIVVTSMTASVVPTLSASAGSDSQPLTSLTVSEANGTVTATWTGALYLPESRTPMARPNVQSSYQVGYTCTLLYGYGVSTAFTVQTSANMCSFSGLNPAKEYGVQVQSTFFQNGVPTISSYPISAFPSNFVVPTSVTTAKHPRPLKHAIACVKGASVKWIAAVHPVCPAGYKVRH